MLSSWTLIPFHCFTDFDLQRKAMLALIEEIDESFLHGAHGCREKRKKLSKLLEEFRDSFQSIANTFEPECDSCITHRRSSTSSPWNPFKQMQDIHRILNKGKGSSSNPKPGEEDPEMEGLNRRPSLSPGETQLSKDVRKVENMNSSEGRIIHNQSNCVQEHIDNEADNLRIQTMRLMDENTRQQTELIKRNDEKRVIIKELHSKLQKMADENRLLKNQLELSGKQPLLTRMKSLFRINLSP